MNLMVTGFLGGIVIAVVLWEAFETVVLPRRITRPFRLTRVFYRATWAPWSQLVGLLPKKRQEYYLSFYGPLSLPLLVAIYAMGLIFGFALLYYAAGSHTTGEQSFANDLYFSGTTFFTLGLGDVTPVARGSKLLTVLEGGTGFGFLALMIGYLPVLYQSFARREVSISLLDARAGSPPTAAELLRRHSHDHGQDALQRLLLDWERWSAELMESHLSYPVLSYFRSQHDNQSWIAALTVILDTCALVMVGKDHPCQRQAELTFAMARHAIVDIAQIFRAAPLDDAAERLPKEDLARLRILVEAFGIDIADDAATCARLSTIRKMYEPFVASLARYLRMPLPGWMKKESAHDNWQASAWGRSGSIPGSHVDGTPEEH